MLAAIAAIPEIAFAQSTTTLSPIVVEGQRSPSPDARSGPTTSEQTPSADAAAKLETTNRAGSALGLTPRETPATVNIVTQRDIEEKGLRTLIEAYRTVPGVVSGNLPGEPGVTSIRGFSRAATGFSVDGSRAPDPLIVSRNYDIFNFERIEIIKGPASVVHGTGALAGAINLVTKQPTLGRSWYEGLVEYGSFNSARAGIGVNTPIGSNAAMRSTLVYSQSDGYVDDTRSRKIGFTNNAVFAPTSDLTISGSVNYFNDDFRTPYQGIPLISRSVARDPSDLVTTTNNMVIDRAIRDRNYNVDDGLMKSDTWWLRGNVEYKLTGNWTFKNEVNFYKADRFWANSEDFTFNTGTNLLDRTTTKITHDHQFWSERATLSYDGPLGPFRNRFVSGVEYINTSFGSLRRFGTTTSVDPFDPDRGTFPADTAANFPTRQNFSSQLHTSATFAENAINLTPAWLIAGGIRYEHSALDRRIDNINTGTTTMFDKTFNSTTWRVGSVYEIVKGTALFAQYTEAAVPVATLLLTNTVNGKFDLSTGRSVEAGIKSTFWDGRVVTTASIYQIDQDNIITRDATNPAVQVQGGSQRSRGIEVDSTVALTRQWSVTVAASWIDAKFTALRGAGGVDLTGNRPVNVPPHTFALLSSYRLSSVPMTVGGMVYTVGPFYTDTTNLIHVNGRVLLDAWIGYDIGGGTLRVRGRNLTNELYADWSGYNSTQVYLGAPRSVDVSYRIKW
jgi:iron complex outermembrane receptor protein